MRHGDVVKMKKCVVVSGQNSFTFAAPKGERFVFLCLGMHAESNPQPFDPEAALKQMGFERPLTNPARRK